MAGDLEDIQVSLGKPITLPGSLGVRHQTWRILAKAGPIDVTLNLSLVEGVDDRSVTVRGTGAMARLDYAQDTLNIRYENAAELVISPLMHQLSQASQHIANGAGNAVRQLTSLNRKNPYALSFTNTVQQIYSDFGKRKGVDSRFSGVSARKVIAAIEAVTALVPAVPPAAVHSGKTPEPKVLVIGSVSLPLPWSAS